MTESYQIQGIRGNIHSDNPRYTNSGKGWKRSYWEYPENELFDITISNVRWTWFDAKDISIYNSDNERQFLSQEDIDKLGNKMLIFNATIQHGELGTFKASDIIIVGIVE
jgi:hypothetical protein